MQFRHLGLRNFLRSSFDKEVVDLSNLLVMTCVAQNHETNWSFQMNFNSAVQKLMHLRMLVFFMCVPETELRAWVAAFQLCIFSVPSTFTKVYVIYFSIPWDIFLLLFLVVASCNFKSPNLQKSLPQPPQSLIATPTAREDLSAAPPTIFVTDNGTVFPLV